MGVGEPNNTFRFIVDTGSTTTLLIDERCQARTCQNHKKYTPSSNLAQVYNDYERINYGGGFVKYQMASDSFFYSNFKIPSQMFGRVTDSELVFDSVTNFYNFLEYIRRSSWSSFPRFC